ncbi:COG4315 family predicted lipoprotein [Brucella haematophila]|uniref:Lipoprotein n=1 Tax=Brucella haematophila TaxID=419474 RepID=A0ABX1DWW2_9HYPH|nr:hypothetical protein [Brucella haematophila]NKC05255.1 hypothetical protein [Brucella haematophila]TMV02537.1 hypothetical protein FGI60_12940 [Brucella haematophila]
MIKVTAFLTTAALVISMPLAAHSEDYASGAVKTMKTAKGEVLTDAKGMTLYVFDKDSKGASNCYDDCAKKWPPLEASKDAKMDSEFSLVTRKDGTKQWAHKEKPLYLWQGDKKPGDVSGDGVGGVWHIAKD